MDPVVSVDHDTIAIDPGGLAKVTVRVRNLNATADTFRLDVLGDAAGWAQLVPTELEVHPNQEAQVAVYLDAGVAHGVPRGHGRGQGGARRHFG